MSLSSLITHLGTVPDHRVDRGKFHRLDDMLFVPICAIISGAEGWSVIEEFGRNKLDWLLPLAFPFIMTMAASITTNDNYGY